MDDIPQATRAFRDAIKPLPPSVEASLLLKQKQVDEAIQLIRHALSQTMPETSREIHTPIHHPFYGFLYEKRSSASFIHIKEDT
jgi:hypothetical protein